MALITYDDKDNSLPTSNPRKLWRDLDSNEVKNVVNTNYTEQTKIVRSAVASGTNSYAATVSPAPAASYGDADQQRFQIKFINASTGLSTLNLNTLGALKIFKTPTEQVGNDDIPANAILNLVLDASLDGGNKGFLIVGGAAASTEHYRGDWNGISLVPDTGDNGNGVGGAPLAGDRWRLTSTLSFDGNLYAAGTIIEAAINSPGQIRANWNIYAMQL